MAKLNRVYHLKTKKLDIEKQYLEDIFRNVHSEFSKEAYKFIMPIANRYLKKIKMKTKDNIVMVPFIQNMYKHLSSCSLYITYGGYNSTMEILKSGIPAIIIPRTDGQKMEQFVRCYTLEPFNFFKVISKSEFNKIPTVIESCLNSIDFPAPKKEIEKIIPKENFKNVK